MLRILKSTLALTMVLALAACNVTAPVVDENADDQITKQQIADSDDSGGTNPPADGQFPDYEEPEEEYTGGGRNRGNEGIR